MRLAVLFLCFAAVQGYQIVVPQFTYLNPGLRISYPHNYNGIQLVAYHFNVNSPLPGVKAGRYNVDVLRRTGCCYVYENRRVALQPGDRVYYWVYVQYDGRGNSIRDRVWTVPGVPVVNTQRPVTQEPATQPPAGTNKPVTSNPVARQGQPLGTCSGSACKASQCTGYPCLIFEDNFDNLNTNVWEHEITLGGGGNWEFQAYLNDRRNTYARDGKLYIKPTLMKDRYSENFVRTGTMDLNNQGCTNSAFYGCLRKGDPGQNHIVNPVISGRLRTHKSFSFKYGKVEVVARMPAGDWLWPAIWMLPTEWKYGGWPKSGEIDITEARGNRNLRGNNGVSYGADMMGSTLHWGPADGLNGYYRTHVDRHTKNGRNYAQDFHTYGLEWTDQHIKFFLDGDQIAHFDPGAGGFYNFGEFYKNNAPNIWNGEGKMAPFNQEFHLILNVAVGGTTGWWGDNYYKPWNNQSPIAMKQFYDKINEWLPTWNQNVRNGEDAAMVVDSVKVWQLAK